MPDQTHGHVAFDPRPRASDQPAAEQLEGFPQSVKNSQQRQGLFHEIRLRPWLAAHLQDPVKKSADQNGYLDLDVGDDAGNEDG